MSVKVSIQQMIDKFHSKIENDEKMRNELSGIVKKVNIDLGDENYSFILDNGKVHSFQDGLLEDADIQLFSDPETIEGLISQRIKPMKAIALRKLKVKGDMEDLLRFRKFF